MTATATDDAAARIERALEKPDDELAAELPTHLDAVGDRTERLLLSHPALFARVARRMDAVDVAALATDQPETVERFQAMVWTGMELLVTASPEVRGTITEDVSVTFTATDAPMTGHVRVIEAENTVRGGTESLSDPDLTISGPADELVALITGTTDPVQGFMQGRFEMAGDVRKGTRLAATMGALTALLG